MSKNTRPQTLKGFRDFLPDEMRVRNFVLGVFKEVFESFGFEPLETPSLEYAETLLGKYGEEADRLVYTFKDRGDRKVGLIYDLTVPVSRFLATYGNKIPLPFKRYQIQRVWRAEKPQKGRYREFVQCDFDIFGVESPLADAEIIAVIYRVLKRLGFEDFKIRLNSRPQLFSVLEESGITEKNQQLEVLRIIDKLDKTTEQEVIEELQKTGLAYPTNGRVLNRLRETKPDENLSKILEYLKAMGLEDKYYCFDPTLVRGLDYYTGPIFEVTVEGFDSSVAGGGRYDNLIESLGGPSIPATGCSLGLDRICDLIIERDSITETLKPTTQVLVTLFPTEQFSNLAIQQSSLTLATELRNQGLSVEVYSDPGARLDKQIKYADRKGIPYVAIIGPKEIEENKVTIKDLRTGEQKTVSRDRVTECLNKSKQK